MTFGIFIEGPPVTKNSNSSKESYRRWKARLDAKLSEQGSPLLPTPPFAVELRFVLPPTSFQPSNDVNQHGADLDNLSKGVLDAIGKTLLKNLGGDGAVYEVRLRKEAASEGEPAGVHISVSPHRPG